MPDRRHEAERAEYHFAADFAEPLQACSVGLQLVVRRCRRLPLIPHCSIFAAIVDLLAAAVREKECTSTSSAVVGLDGWEDVAVTALHAIE